MTNYNILIKAIKERRTIEFEYVKEGKPIGKRYGNPHAMYTFSDDAKNKYVDIFQTEGVSSTPASIPGFRQFLVEHICNVKIVNELEKFAISEEYNPYSDKYRRALALVKVRKGWGRASMLWF